MFQKILIPLDGSAFAEQALPGALIVARSCHAALELAMVHEPSPVDSVDGDRAGSAHWNHDRDYLEALSREVASGASVRVTNVLLRGEVVDRLCRHIADEGVDLVVTTSHGRTGLIRAWLGSVADGLVRRSNVPVLIVRPSQRGTRHTPAVRALERILLPVDASPVPRDMFAAITSVAERDGARIALLHVVEPPPLVFDEAGVPSASPSARLDDPATVRMADEARHRLAVEAGRLRGQTPIEITSEVSVEADVAQAIADFAGSGQFDLIAMCTHGRGASRVFVGSVADKVLRGTSLPVLLYRQKASPGRAGVEGAAARSTRPTRSTR